MILLALERRCKSAHAQVRTASCSAANCVNTFGDEQLAVDLLADKLLFEALKFSVSGLTLPQPPSTRMHSAICG